MMALGDHIARENAIKLDMLESIARSQRALAGILESVGRIAEEHDQAAADLLAHAQAISRYERMLVYKISGWKLRSVKKGKPGKPWLREQRHLM